MTIDALATYWGKQMLTENDQWVHPDDRLLFAAQPHSFNLDFPAPAFVGDILGAKIIILAANGGYDPFVTAEEFKEPDAAENYMHRLNNPSHVNWAKAAPYYRGVNYAHLLFNGTNGLQRLAGFLELRLQRVDVAFHHRHFQFPFGTGFGDGFAAFIFDLFEALFQFKILRFELRALLL